MTKYKLEYLWLDGYTPVPNLRGKTQIKEFSEFPKAGRTAMWGFDGSSTLQAEGSNSDLCVEAGEPVPGQHTQERRHRDVRSHDAGRQDPASVEQARHHSRR